MLDLEHIDMDRLMELYENVEDKICLDILNKLGKVDFSITYSQVRTLAQLNAREVFDQAMEVLAQTNSARAEELKNIFNEEVKKNNLKSYKKQFEYNGKKLRLNDNQLKILNKGLYDTRGTLSNLTKTIAYASQKAYVDMVDKAYMQVATGGIDYNTAIYNASKELADNGIKLEITTKKGVKRHIQLDVAVRQNVLAGIHQTADTINEDIDQMLGCNGYQVTAHIGARPTHAEAQGKQYAITRALAKKYHVSYWGDVEQLWHEYNCRHSYYGIILGINETIYNDYKLKQMENAQVNYNYKKIPYYEATQMMRQMERNIRKQKRTINLLKETKTEIPQGKIQELEDKLYQSKNEYRNFTRQTKINARPELLKA